jgi:hypothetical protein
MRLLSPINRLLCPPVTSGTSSVTIDKGILKEIEAFRCRSEFNRIWRDHGLKP